jgi:cytochrome c peroxidase
VRLLLLLLLATSCWPHGAAALPYQWNVPLGFPLPRVPEDNPMTVEKVALGRFLFYDTRMSGNQTYACASCHQQEHAFTDTRTVAIGSTGEMHPRNSMSVTNIAYNTTFGWGNPLLISPELQAMVPMFGETPVELGLSGLKDELLSRFQADARYRRLFAEAYSNDADPITLANLINALTSFERTLISGNSPYDRYINGLDDNAISASAYNGGRLFFSERLECFHCHNAGSYSFASSETHEGKAIEEILFTNNGLYNIDGKGGYPPNNTGIYEITNKPEDMGAFKAPTLRNIELTAPYMHDGSISTLDGVIDHYARGGTLTTDGPYAGDGATNPYKSGFIRGFTLTDQEREDVLSFLKSLTDMDFVTNPHFSNPFTGKFCTGDCNLDGTVTLDELISSVNVGLESAPLAACVVADPNGDGTVAINELIAAVNAALNGCNEATPTPTPSTP